MNKLALQRLQARLGYTFEQPELLVKALTHRSVGAQNNERQEFLGDAILDFIIGEVLFHKFPNNREGDLSRMRSQLVRGDTLALIAREFELGLLLSLGDGEKKSGGHNRDSILADAVEAIIAAIYLDCNSFTKVRELVLVWFESRIESVSPDQQKDAKTQLQELLQKHGHGLPVYTLLEQQGDAHALQFEIRARVDALNKEATAKASGRKKAEQLAAKALLAKIQEI